MNDFDALLVRVIRQAETLRIPISPSIDPHVRNNRRAVTRFGCCIKEGDRYIIELSERMLAAEERACMQTLAHEILHTCRGCRNHGERWKSYAAKMNAGYGYTLSRTQTCQSLGVPDIKPARYVLVCRECGQEFRRARASELVKHPERYRCKCGGRLDRRPPQEPP